MSSYSYGSLQMTSLLLLFLRKMYTHIEVDLEDYFWDIMPREKADDLIKNLEAEFGNQNVIHSKHKITKLHGNHHQLEAIREIVPKLAGIGKSDKATATTITSQVLARSLEISSIPFITDSVDKLKQYLKDAIDQHGRVHVEDIISPIKGDMGRAVIVFQSTKGRYMVMKCFCCCCFFFLFVCLFCFCFVFCFFVFVLFCFLFLQNSTVLYFQHLNLCQGLIKQSN